MALGLGKAFKPFMRFRSALPRHRRMCLQLLFEVSWRTPFRCAQDALPRDHEDQDILQQVATYLSAYIRDLNNSLDVHLICVHQIQPERKDISIVVA